jgi:hypothetical protein
VFHQADLFVNTSKSGCIILELTLTWLRPVWYFEFVLLIFDDGSKAASVVINVRMPIKKFF